MRTKIHDEFASLGVAGIEAALVACGHRSHKMAEHYRTKAFQLLASNHIRATAAENVSDAESDQYF